ncbi:MaoC family dehydratase [Roseovarius salinarum]|uniref:MaoC family dehydratase n=1 Tax=Roseovarius salinarum TaxID=1981892 RepID=UPI000C330447|nr:MaoC family dehydratase [Roseovarius salinarum]
MYLDDLEEGFTFETESRTLDEAEIVDFARQWDPQPFHLDAEAAAASPYGGIIASGFHTMLVAFRLTLEAGIWNKASMGSPGMDDIRWLVPVRPDDTLRATGRVVSRRFSGSRPDRGRAVIAYEVLNQEDAVVMTYTATHILRRRP